MQKDIDEFREAFYLYARKGFVETPGHLRYIMRCLGSSPTVTEAENYFKTRGSKVDFATFLDVMHEHSKREKPMQEVVAAFRAHDRQKTGQISAKELRSILMGIGERLTNRQVDIIFKEANINPNTMVRYEDFVKLVASPLPDYY